MMIMTFRKALGLPIIAAEERRLTIMREGKKGKMDWGNKKGKGADGYTPIQGRLFSKYHDFLSNGMELG